jgi:hypothetical protein
VKIEDGKKPVTRLLFIKRRWRDAILAGVKTVELRDEKRYRSMRIGDIFAMNGREKIRIIGIKKVFTADILENRELMHSCGFRDPMDIAITFADIGIGEKSSLLAFHVQVLNGK